MKKATSSPPASGGPTLLPLLVLCFCAARLAREARAQQLQQQQEPRLPPLPKVDPLSDGILVRSTKLPSIAAAAGGGEDGDAGAVGGGPGSKSVRRRLIMYDFRPAFPPYTRESLEELLLIPKDEPRPGDGEETISGNNASEDRSEGGEEEPTASDLSEGRGDDGDRDDDVGRGVSQDEAADGELSGASVKEAEAPAVEDGETSADEATDSSDETASSPTEPSIPVEEADATKERPAEDQPTPDDDSRIEASDVPSSELDATPFEIELVAGDPEKSETSSVEDAEANMQESEEEEVLSSNQEMLADDGDANDGADVPSFPEGVGRVVVESESTEAPPGGERSSASEEDPNDAARNDEGTKDPNNLDSVDLGPSASDEATPDGSEGDPISNAPTEAGGERGAASEDAMGGTVEHVAALSETTELDPESRARDAAADDTGGAQNPEPAAVDPREEEGAAASDDDDDGQPTKESRSDDGDGPPVQSEAIVGDEGDRPKGRITVRYDEPLSASRSSDEPPRTTTTTQSSSSAEGRGDANRRFVDGLDEIDKLFESVDAPDELDVGADGSSMQDVLVGQGLKILWKRARNFGRGVSDRFGGIANGVKGALPLGGLLARDEEEEEDVTLDSLLEMTRSNEDGRSLSGDGDAGSKRANEQVNRPKSEKKRRKRKEKKDGGLPLINKSPRARGIWKFARRKWEQARLVLEDLLRIFDGADDDEDVDFSLEGLKLGKDVLPSKKGAAGGTVPNFDGRFGSEVDESFLKSRYEAMMRLQQQEEEKKQ